jgi:hypothetical protein
VDAPLIVSSKHFWLRRRDFLKLERRQEQQANFARFNQGMICIDDDECMR